MCKETNCEGCIFVGDLKSCTSHHVEEARKLISKGNIEEADKNLSSLQDHLKE